jgi:hypothetical protein
MTNRIARIAAPVAFLGAAAASMSLLGPGAGASVTASSSAAGARMLIGGDPICIAEIPGVPMSLCFAPGTPAEEIAEVSQRLQAQWANDLATREQMEGGTSYQLGNRWILNGSSSLGQPLTLRWSMPADGLSIPDGLFGGAASPNNLNATFTTKFGGVEAGKNLLRQVFQRWSDLSGVTYQEVSDDGAAWPNSSGGSTRGDVRIVGRNFQSTGVLAYNFFPNTGDMCIVTSNSGLWTTTNQNRYFRNIIAHEHGHGLGFEHVCPQNSTKLMEPFLATNFDGPQTDDIRCVNRAYGDRFEPNDSAASGSSGWTSTTSATTSLVNVSIDDNSDVDFYKFTATAGSTLSVSLVASGSATAYNSGPQNNDGSCSAGSPVNARTIHDLNFQVLQGPSGSIVLSTAASAAAGSTEAVSNLSLPASDTYTIRVYPSTTTDDVQMYALSVTLNLAPATPGDMNGDDVVDGADLGILLALWGPITCGNNGDFNDDCKVDGADLGVLLANWG